jgi:hypothetical protein
MPEIIRIQAVHIIRPLFQSAALIFSQGFSNLRTIINKGLKSGLKNFCRKEHQKMEKRKR